MPATRSGPSSPSAPKPRAARDGQCTWAHSPRNTPALPGELAMTHSLASAVKVGVALHKMAGPKPPEELIELDQPEPEAPEPEPEAEPEPPPPVLARPLWRRVLGRIIRPLARPLVRSVVFRLH